jgi:DNA ligase-1
MKFIDVATTFDAIEKESSRTQITILLADLLKRTSAQDAATIAYLSLGSLNPTYVGTQFNFAEKGMVKLVAKLLHQTQHEVVEQMNKLGDMGLVMQNATWPSTANEPLSVSNVKKYLTQFLSITGTGSQEVKEQFLLQLLEQLDTISAKYVIRIVLGSLRLGFSDMTLLDAFSWMECGDKSIREDLETAYNTCADIGLIVKTLKEQGICSIKEMTITPGIPIRPSAAERLPDAASIIEKIGTCIAQPKLDGFRLQVHLDHRNKQQPIHFYSRNLQDMSRMFPDLYSAVLELPVENIVVEGEAIAYDLHTHSFLPFQETVKRRRKHDISKVAQDFPLKLYLFDILYKDGKPLLNKTHEERRAILLKLLHERTIEQKQVILPIEETVVHTAKELEEYFNANISSGLEGLVAKRPDAIYKPGKRNFNWIKLKRQESGSLEDTIDCTILGYYYGQGKRASFGIGALLVGIFNEEKDCFQSIAKIGTGLTDEEWIDQKKACDHIKLLHKPHNVECAKELFPDVWTNPEIVCMIRADEITLSPLHSTGKTEKHSGFALRFPRLMGYRPDKSARETTTLSEISDMYKHQFSKKKKH